MSDYPPCPGVEHTHVDAAGLRVHVAQAGDPAAPPVVLLHGWPQHWWCWRGVIPLLARTHRVHAVDLRGHGWTEITPAGYEKEQFASDLLATMDALGLERTALAGHDWGGWTAQLAGLRAPERFSAIALLNISGPWGEPRRTLPHAWRFLYQPVVGTPVLGPAIQRSGLLPQAMARQGVPRADAEVFAARLREPGRAEAGSKVYRTFVLHEMRGILAGRYDAERLRMPVRMLYGEDDSVIRPAMLEGIAEHADDYALERVPDTGHFIADQRPELVADRLATWFAAA
jgi:pimeloyl-ACP methyl ester carboxylesterase